MPADAALTAAWFTPGFNHRKLDQYLLSVLAKKDGQVFLVTSKEGNPQALVRLGNTSLQMQASDPASLRIRLESSGLPLGRYRSACLFLRSERYSILPGFLANGTDPEKFLSLRHSIKDGEIVTSDRQADLSAFFVNRPALLSLMEEYSHSCKVFSYGMVVAREALRLSESREDILLADLDARTLDIALAGKNKLRFINTFPVRTAEDAAYHLLNVYRSLEMPPHVWLTGGFTPQSRAGSLVRPYIAAMDYLRAEKNLPEEGVPGGSDDVQLLLKSLPCES
jgi:hypothetical protein